MTQTKIMFVGERRSDTAKRKGWTWRDGRLAAKTLFEALRGISVDPLAQEFCNLYPDEPRPLEVTDHRKRRLREIARTDVKIVALGRKVSDGLAELGIEHVAIVHPAARGWIRGRGRYAAHVREVLGLALGVA